MMVKFGHNPFTQAMDEQAVPKTAEEKAGLHYLKDAASNALRGDPVPKIDDAIFKAAAVMHKVYRQEISIEQGQRQMFDIMSGLNKTLLDIFAELDESDLQLEGEDNGDSH